MQAGCYLDGFKGFRKKAAKTFSDLDFTTFDLKEEEEEEGKGKEEEEGEKGEGDNGVKVVSPRGY